MKLSQKQMVAVFVATVLLSIAGAGLLIALDAKEDIQQTAISISKADAQELVNEIETIEKNLNSALKDADKIASNMETELKNAKDIESVTAALDKGLTEIEQNTNKHFKQKISNKDYTNALRCIAVGALMVNSRDGEMWESLMQQNVHYLKNRGVSANQIVNDLNEIERTVMVDDNEDKALVELDKQLQKAGVMTCEEFVD